MKPSVAFYVYCNMSRAMAGIPIGSYILQILPEHVIPRDDKRLIILLVKAIQATTGPLTPPIIQKRIDCITVTDASDSNIVWNRPPTLSEEPYATPFATENGEHSDESLQDALARTKLPETPTKKVSFSSPQPTATTITRRTRTICIKSKAKPGHNSGGNLGGSSSTIGDGDHDSIQYLAGQ